MGKRQRYGHKKRKTLKTRQRFDTKALEMNKNETSEGTSEHLVRTEGDGFLDKSVLAAVRTRVAAVSTHCRNAILHDERAIRCGYTPVSIIGVVV